MASVVFLPVVPYHLMVDVSSMPAIEPIEIAPELRDEILRCCADLHSSFTIMVTGGCMVPDLSPGETVRLSPRSVRPPRFGDIVLVRQPNGLRLHRLVWRPVFVKSGPRWRTMADRAVAWDSRVSSDDLIATVIAVEGGCPRRVSPRRLKALRLLAGALFSRVWRAVVRRVSE